MTPEELLAQLVDMGAVLWVPDAGHFNVASARLTGGGLFWVTQFADDQHHAHHVKGKATVEFNRYLAVHARGTLVAYVGRASDWPEVDQEAYADERAAWMAYLSDADNQAAFDRFVEQEAAGVPT